MTAETKKTILLFIGSTIVSVATVVISFGLYAGRDENKIIDQKLEQKVDKVQYKEDCDKLNERVKNVENINQLLQEIKVEQSATRTDIEWIKKNLDKKQK